MGNGIAQVAATAGYTIALADVAEDALVRGRARIADSLGRFVASKRLPEGSVETVTSRIGFVTDALTAAASADLVIESVVEDLPTKQDLFARLDRICAEDVVLATNTSQFPIATVCRFAAARQRVIGMHWSNPPPMMPLVEVVPSAATSAGVLSATLDFVHSCGHRTVVCRKDAPGFISSRLFQALVLEGLRIVEEGLATAEEVDDVARLMHGHKMGPLAALDFAGLDTALRVSRELTAAYGARFAAPALLESLVQAGRYGRKTGHGVHDYREPDTQRPASPTKDRHGISG